MAQPLELSYSWQAPVGVSTVALLVLSSLLLSSRPPGWLAVAGVLVACWVGLLVVVYLRTRAYLAVEEGTLRVRRFGATAEISGAEVTAVRQYPTPVGPCYRLQTSGRARPYAVPTALLRDGSATLFEWLSRFAPEAVLDRASGRTRERLRTSGRLA